VASHLRLANAQHLLSSLSPSKLISYASVVYFEGASSPAVSGSSPSNAYLGNTRL
jgi:hypothetical protein